ncbi:MAG: Histidine kinaselike ATPase domain [Pseudomonadota bacterium]
MRLVLLDTRIPARLDAASQLCADVAALVAAELGEQPGCELRLGLMESLSNIIRHGGLAEQALIGVRVESDPTGWRLSISDAGRPIPAEQLRQAASAALDPEPYQPAFAPTSGMGLQLLYRIFDRIDYHSGAQGNLLRLQRCLNRSSCRPRTDAPRSRPR